MSLKKLGKEEEGETELTFDRLPYRVILYILEIFEIELKYYEDYTFSFFYGYFKSDNLRRLRVVFSSLVVQATDQLDVIPLRFMKHITSSKRETQLRFPYILAHLSENTQSVKGFFMSKKTIKVLSRSNRRHLHRLCCHTSKISDRVLESLNSFRRLRHLWIKIRKKRTIKKMNKIIISYDQLRKERKKTKDETKIITKSLFIPTLHSLQFENIFYEHMLLKQVQHCPNLRSVTICKSEVKKKLIQVLNDSKTVIEVRFIKSKLEDLYVKFFTNKKLRRLEINECDMNVFLLKNVDLSLVKSSVDNDSHRHRIKKNRREHSLRRRYQRTGYFFVHYKLEEVRLLMNQFPLHLIQQISNNYRRLNTLHLSLQNLTDEYVDCINGMIHLKFLMLHSLRAKNEKFESTIKDFESLVDLSFLKMKNMTLSPSLLYFLVDHRMLNRLVIKECVITDRQLTSVSRNKSIQFLKINDCDVGDKIYKLFEMKQLIKLDLNNCFGFDFGTFEKNLITSQLFIPPKKKTKKKNKKTNRNRYKSRYGRRRRRNNEEDDEDDDDEKKKSNNGSRIEKLSLFGITVTVGFFKILCDNLDNLKQILLVECDLEREHYDVLMKFPYWRGRIVTLYVNSDDVLNRYTEEIQEKHRSYNFVKV